MSDLKNEHQLFYSQNGETWLASTNGKPWADEKCDGWMHKHLSWHDFQGIVITPKSQDQIDLEFAQSENSWVLEQMPIIERNINYHLDNDDRATSTEQIWRNYRASLRNYVKDNIVTMPSRPLPPA